LAAVLARHPRFATRVFTDAELSYCQQHHDAAPRLAARFAAKEAVLKALGTGLARGMRWREVEVVSGRHQQPGVRLHGAVAAAARRLGVHDVQVGLSHHGEYALACAVTVPIAPERLASDGEAADADSSPGED